MPIRTGTRANPPDSAKRSKSKRVCPVIWSGPTRPMNRPISEARTPLTMLPWETQAMVVMAKRISAKVSMGPKFSEKRASSGAMRTSRTSENMPPMKDATVAQPRASAALPCCAMG